MSGGVDSSVAACLLKEQGYDVIGIHMRFWSETVDQNGQPIKKMENKCCSIESWELAAEIAKKIGIPFHILDLEENFKEKIVDYYLEEQQNALTPNPCVECNRHIKFGLFLDALKKFGADYVSTGHYLIRKEVKEGSKIHYRLYSAKDTAKDQSYFLYTLNQEKLKHVLFPIGEYTKPEIRILAEKFGINFINKKKESQNLCFIPEKDPSGFLKRNLPASAIRPGPIVTVEGKVVGEHRGLPLYTIGQRKGIGLGGIAELGGAAGEPWFVVRKDQNNNSLIIGRESDLYNKTLRLKKITFVDREFDGQIEAKIRFRSPAAPAELIIKENNRGEIIFKNAQRAVTPGQSVVFYIDNELLGGAVIEK
jgi:tRNA-specific 2-thiouridylase